MSSSLITSHYILQLPSNMHKAVFIITHCAFTWLLLWSKVVGKEASLKSELSLLVNLKIFLLGNDGPRRGLWDSQQGKINILFQGPKTLCEQIWKTGNAEIVKLMLKQGDLIRTTLQSQNTFSRAKGEPSVAQARVTCTYLFFSEHTDSA